MGPINRRPQILISFFAMNLRRLIYPFAPIALSACLVSACLAQIAAPGKTFIDYFQPTPITQPLSAKIWGAATVGPRDPGNGLEDTSMQHWDYWDGQIIKGKDGRYHLFASRWDQATGHNGWWSSKAVHAVSDKLTGPYVDKGLLWPDDQDGKGHNVTALVLPDGRYAVVVSETRPGDVFISKSLDGPWEHIGAIQLAKGEFSEGERMSNLSIMVRPDGGFEIVPRSGKVWISRTGILGPYTVEGPSVFTTIPELASRKQYYLEDPVVWFSGGLYHITVNDWNAREAFHLTSADGITHWVNRGLAYDPRKAFVRYTDGTVNHWEKMERPSVYIEDGHIVAVTLAVIDVPKDDEKGNDGHGSKVIVIPFDGAAMDRDIARADKAAAASSR